MKRDFKCVWDAKAVLGESPVWVPTEGALYWVDIKNPTLHRYCPSKDNRDSWPLPETVGCVAPLEDNQLLVALKSGLYAFPTPQPNQNLQLSLLAPAPTTEASLRFNDGKRAPDGVFWVGTMDDREETDIGCWYRFDPAEGLRQVACGYRVTNGPAFDPDRKCMYVTDSARRTIFRATGWGTDVLAGKTEVFRIFGSNQGTPDGMTVDESGRLWVAFWGAACVRALDPETAEILDTIRLPAPRPTSCIFGGSEGDILFITSASVGLNENLLRRFPQSGGVFALKMSGVRGCRSVAA